MKLRPLFAASLLALACGSVFAMHCPADMKAIDEALAKKPSLSAADMAGREHFLALPEAVRDVRCGRCAGCAVRCPNGVEVARRVGRAQSLFA